MEFTENIIDNTLNSFDFGFIVCINVATYIINKIISETVPERSTTWNKRIILIMCSLFLSAIYHFFNLGEDKLILNSAIVAPVFWSWIGKPIMKKLNVDYK